MTVIHQPQYDQEHKHNDDDDKKEIDDYVEEEEMYLQLSDSMEDCPTQEEELDDCDDDDLDTEPTTIVEQEPVEELEPPIADYDDDSLDVVPIVSVDDFVMERIDLDQCLELAEITSTEEVSGGGQVEELIDFSQHVNVADHSTLEVTKEQSPFPTTTTPLQGNVEESKEEVTVDHHVATTTGPPSSGSGRKRPKSRSTTTSINFHPYGHLFGMRRGDLPIERREERELQRLVCMAKMHCSTRNFCRRPLPPPPPQHSMQHVYNLGLLYASQPILSTKPRSAAAATTTPPHIPPRPPRKNLAPTTASSSSSSDHKKMTRKKLLARRFPWLLHFPSTRPLKVAEAPRSNNEQPHDTEHCAPVVYRIMI